MKKLMFTLLFAGIAVVSNAMETKESKIKPYSKLKECGSSSQTIEGDCWIGTVTVTICGEGLSSVEAQARASIRARQILEKTVAVEVARLEEEEPC